MRRSGGAPPRRSPRRRGRTRVRGSSSSSKKDKNGLLGQPLRAATVRWLHKDMRRPAALGGGRLRRRERATLNPSVQRAGAARARGTPRRVRRPRSCRRVGPPAPAPACLRPLPARAPASARAGSARSTRRTTSAWTAPWRVKVIPAGGPAPERAQREARAVARLDHPAIVGLFDAGEEDGCRYLVSELVEGRTLAQLQADGRAVGPRRAARRARARRRARPRARARRRAPRRQAAERHRPRAGPRPPRRGEADRLRRRPPRRARTR